MSAGLTVGTILIPQSMAYALLAGMPPIYGLYASLVPLIIYAIFASSSKLSVGPVAISALLVLAGISQVAEPGSAQYISYVITTGLLVGLLQILLGTFKLGFLVNFLSHPVIAGFTSAAAIIICASQIKDAFGIEIESRGTFNIFSEFATKLDQIHIPTFALTTMSIIVILILKKVSKNIPSAFLVVICALALSYYMDLKSMGVNIIEDIPSGLPEFILPDFSMDTLSLILPTVVSVTVIGIVESIGIAKALESKHKDHTVNPNQEMLALGLAKVAGSFFQALPTSGSFSRSAINSNNGAKTTVSTLIVVVMVSLALLFLTSVFYYLPKPVLAAIILLAVLSLFDIKEAKHLWKTNKKDLAMMAITFAATLSLGIKAGILCGVLMSIGLVLYKTSRPHVAELGNIPGTRHYKNLERYEETTVFPDTLMIRFDNQIFFGNSAYFKDKVYELIAAKPQDISYVILDGSNISDIDSTGMHVLQDLDNDLKKKNIELHLCGAIGPVRDALYLSGLLKELDKHHVNVNDAITAIYGPELNPDQQQRITDPLQTNEEL